MVMAVPSRIFEPIGPLEVPYTVGVKGTQLVDVGCRSFWDAYPDLADRTGCYVFGIRASRGYRPVYVGKATRTFRQECFTDHKVCHDHRALAETDRGTPIMFLVCAPTDSAPIEGAFQTEPKNFGDYCRSATDRKVSF